MVLLGHTLCKAGPLTGRSKCGVREQAERFEECLATFARDIFGCASEIRCATFVVAEVPLAAVKGHLQRREVQPIVNELITKTYHASIVPSSRL